MLGKGDRHGTERVSAFCFYISLAVGVVLAVLMTLFSSPLLSLLGTDESTYSYARDYYMVLAGCAPVVVAAFVHSDLLRCEGLSRESMQSTVLGAVINIVLDSLMISTLRIGAEGAAVATVIGYLSSVIYCLVIVKRKSRYISIRIRDAVVTKKETGEILGVGISGALASLSQSFMTLILNLFLLSYGSSAIAAMGIASKIKMVIFLILTGFSFGGVPLFGYLHGAGDRTTLRKLIRFCLAFFSSFAIIMTVLIIFSSSSLMRIFVFDSVLIETGAVMLRWQVFSSVFAGIVLLLTVLFESMGKVVPSLLLSISRQGVVFLISIVVCSRLFGYTGVLMSQAVADVISAAIAGGMYLYSVRRS